MAETDAGTTGERTRFGVDASTSALLVEARSTVGLVSFGTATIDGAIVAVATDEQLDTRHECEARLTVPLSSLTSGNALYDAELQQRLAVTRYPEAVVELLTALPLSGSDHHVAGQITIHGVTCVLQGDVRIARPDPDTVRITGESVIDIRDFGIAVPSLLMLRIYPDVRVSLELVARRARLRVA